MAPPDPLLRNSLRAAALALGLDLSTHQTDNLFNYLALLQRWNGTYNLTSVRDPAQMLSVHLVDCLALIGPLRRYLQRSAGTRVLDVGSGAGLPGVVIAALNSDLAVTCVETVGKKAAFVRQVAAELGLLNLASAHSRVERLDVAAFHVITSRAFASLADFVRLTKHQLAVDGVWLAMKGKRPDEELAQLDSNVEVFHVEPLTVPGLAAERCLVWMRHRTNDT